MGHTFDESRLLPKPCLPRPPDSVRLQLTGRHPGRYLPHSTQHAALESPGRRTHRLGGARTSKTSLICKPKTKTRSGCTPDAGAKKLTMLRVVHRKQAQQTQKNRAPIKTLVLFAHGCGYTGLSWAVCVDALACRLGNETLLAAFDARGHGKSCGNAEQNYSGESEKNKNDSVNFSAHRLARDVLDVTKELLRVCSVSSTGAGTGAGAGATSTSATRTRLSAGAYQNDARSNSRNNPTEPRRPVNVVFVGHSMGGAVAARAASLFESGGRENDSEITQETKSTVTSLRADPDQNQFVLAGVVVVDVVEGTAVASLPAAELAVSKIPKSFGTIKSAIEWSLKAGVTSNVTSAQVSTPSRLVLVETNPDKYYVWRTEIGATAKYWNGWFSGLSSVFLSNPKLPKLLVVAQTDRLDTELTIAQMTGLFQLIVVPNTGHAIHEDNPRAVAVAVDRFLKRFVG